MKTLGDDLHGLAEGFWADKIVKQPLSRSLMRVASPAIAKEAASRPVFGAIVVSLPIRGKLILQIPRQWGAAGTAMV